MKTSTIAVQKIQRGVMAAAQAMAMAVRAEHKRWNLHVLSLRGYKIVGSNP